MNIEKKYSLVEDFVKKSSRTSIARVDGMPHETVESIMELFAERSGKLYTRSLCEGVKVLHKGHKYISLIEGENKILLIDHWILRR